MKKKIFGALVVVAIAVGAMTNVNLSKSNSKGDLAMANVEALASGEQIGGFQWKIDYRGYGNYTCYQGGIMACFI